LTVLDGKAICKHRDRLRRISGHRRESIRQFIASTRRQILNCQAQLAPNFFRVGALDLGPGMFGIGDDSDTAQRIDLRRVFRRASSFTLRASLQPAVTTSRRGRTCSEHQQLRIRR
jgi:hypothetical protein